MKHYLAIEKEISLNGYALSDVEVNVSVTVHSTREEADEHIKERMLEVAEYNDLIDFDSYDEDEEVTADNVILADDGYSDFSVEHGVVSWWTSDGDGTRFEFTVEEIDL